jgi:hypothetical protein
MMASSTKPEREGEDMKNQEQRGTKNRKRKIKKKPKEKRKDKEKQDTKTLRAWSSWRIKLDFKTSPTRMKKPLKD